MILWCDGGHDAAENMRRDASLLEDVRAGRRDETLLRLFQFVPPGITLGMSQVPERELDLEQLAAAGLTWAMRPTGGRAIYHDEEWTFSLVGRLGAAGWGATAGEAYRRTSELFARALRRLGAPLELAAGSAGGAGRPRERSGPAAPCFASTARHELVLGGRKVAGIAQRETGGVLLQQGSLLLGESHLRVPQFLRVPAAGRAAIAAQLRDRSATLAPWLGASAPLEHLAGALREELPQARWVGGDSEAVLAGLSGGGW